MHRFEAILGSPTSASDPWDKAVAQSPSFVAFPSLGAMVPGWLLVVPRRSLLSLRELGASEREELHRFAGELHQRLSAFSGEVFYFEHGNTTPGGPVGCGVDQAHLHLVPLGFDLVDAAAESRDGDIVWTSHADAASFTSIVPMAGEYVSIWQPSNGRGISGTMREPRSQWVRRLIAMKLGREEAWDYKTHPNVQNLLLTVDTLRTV